jgi:hypothetical protein
MMEVPVRNKRHRQRCIGGWLERKYHTHMGLHTFGTLWLVSSLFFDFEEPPPMAKLILPFAHVTIRIFLAACMSREILE